MKLALLFLVGFLAISLQQQQQQQQKQSYLAFLQPRMFFYPLENRIDSNDDADDSLLDQSKVGQISEDGRMMIQPRTSNRWWNNNPSISNALQKIQPRRPIPLRRYFYNNGNGYAAGYLSRPTFDLLNPFTPAVYRTSMVTASSTSTVLAASIINCIPSTLFSSGASAITCRRRRQIAEIMDLLAAQDNYYEPSGEARSIEPSTIQPVEPSILMMTSNNRNWQNIDIKSSKYEDNEDDNEIQQQNRRIGSLWFNRNSDVVTYTTTSIYYIFSSTVILKRASLVSQQSALICIPSGYTVC